MGKQDPPGWHQERAKLHDSAEVLGEIGSWQWEPASDVLTWSDNVFRIFGLSPNEVEPTTELIVEQTLPDDREHVRHQVEHLKAEDEIRILEYRISRPDGEIRNLRSTIVEVESGPRRLIGFVQDITETRRAEREIQAHVAVAEALGRWESFEQDGERLLQALGVAMEFAAGAIWLPDAEGLIVSASWRANSADERNLEDVALDRRMSPGHGLAGQAWESGRPIASAGKGALAFPALKGDEVLAVLEFHSREEFETSDRLMESLMSIGRELGHVLNRRRRELLPSTLTPREREVLQLAARGGSAPNIAEELVVSRDTVKTHMRHIYTKLEVRDRAAAVAEGLRRGLIE